MSDFKTLKILDSFKGLFEKSGIDYENMRRILQIKLLMDGRRVPTLFHKPSRKEEPAAHSNNFFKSLWIYFFLGLFLILIIVMGQNFIFQMSLVFGILMFMIMTSLISDFSSVMLDVRDRSILFSKPIDRRTIGMAKVIHIMIYLAFITGSLTIPPLIAGLIKHGILFFLVFLAAIILMDVFIIGLTAAIYWFVLRYFDGEKLKDFINYVQIALTIAMTVGYQLISRMFTFMDIKWSFTPHWWQFMIFPVWFAAPFELLFSRNHGVYMIVFTILSIVAPLLSVWLYIKMIPSFEKNLQKLTSHSGRSKKGYLQWFDAIGRLICKGREEQLFFHFASSMMKKERDFKLKVYPSLGFSLIFPFIFMLNNLRTATGWEGLRSGHGYLFLYFCAIMIPSVVMMLKFSGAYKGAWIYGVVPLKDTAAVYKGTLKACIVRLLMPVYLLLSIIFLLIFGWRIIPDLIVVFFSFLLYSVLSFLVFGKQLPFSQPYQTTQQGGGLMIILLLILLGVFVGLHYAASIYINYGVYILMAVLLAANLVAWKLAFQKTAVSRK